MVTVKLPQTRPDNRAFYHCVRLWKRDLIDVAETLKGAGCELTIEDETHTYADVEDFLTNAPTSITAIKIIGRTDDFSWGQNTGVYFRLDANLRVIATDYEGEPIKGKDLNNHLGFLFTRRAKGIGIFLRRRWVEPTVLPIVWLATVPPLGVFLNLKADGFLPSRALAILEVISLVMLLVIYFFVERFFVRCDFWFRKNDGEDTFFRRNSDKIGLEIVKGTSAALVGGIISHYIFH